MKAKRNQSRHTCLKATPIRLSVLLACALAAAVAFQGARGLYDTTEGRYVECAREMAQAGTWLEPVLNGQPHWTKPPLTYICIMIPYQLFGPTTWGARAYLIPCYLIAIVGVWWLTLRLWEDHASANMSALVYATMVFSMGTSHIVSTDYPLTAALALTMACFGEVLRKRSALAVHLTWFCLGLAFLVKGPPALLMLPAMILVWARLPREARRQMPLFAPSALALFLIVGGSWYAWEAWHHPELGDYWLNNEVVNRAFSDKFNRNHQFYKNFEIYLPILLGGTLPWSAWLAYRWRAVRTRIALAGGWKRAWFSLSDADFWLVWAILIPLIVFAFSQSKMPLYLLPLFVPLAAVTGRLLQTIDGGKPWFRKCAITGMCVMFVLFIAVKAAMAFMLKPERDRMLLHRELTGLYGIHDPKRLAVYGNVHPNGLSYYYDYVLPLVNRDELEQWALAGGERFVLYRHNRQEAEIEQFLKEKPMAAEQHVLRKKWRVICFNGVSTTRPQASGRNN